MKQLSIRKVFHDKFESAVLRVAKYLYDNRSTHKQFRFKWQLVKKFGISIQFYNSIERVEKRLPPDTWGTITKVLTQEFNVNPVFLHTNTGEMFLKRNELEEPSVEYFKTPGNKVHELEHENEQLKETIKRLEQLVETQADLISALKSKSAKATDKIHTARTTKE